MLTVIHPFDLLPASVLWLSDVEDKAVHTTHPSPRRKLALVHHRVCFKDGEIVLCDTDVLKGNHVQKGDESCQDPTAWPVKCVCNLVFPRFP